jgi:hypothetical protein
MRVKFQWVKLEFSFIDNFKIYETWIFFAYNVNFLKKYILKYFLKIYYIIIIKKILI